MVMMRSGATEMLKSFATAGESVPDMPNQAAANGDFSNIRKCYRDIGRW